MEMESTSISKANSNRERGVAVERGRPFRGYRGRRGRGRRGASRGASTFSRMISLPPPVLQPPVILSPPGVYVLPETSTTCNNSMYEPTTIFKTPLLLQSDPMYEHQDNNTYGFYYLNRRRDERVFNPTFEGFMPLCKETYNQISAVNKELVKYVSESVFVWYCAQHLYARMMSIRPRDDKVESYIIDQFQQHGGDFVIPGPIDYYLRSFGNFRGVSGVTYRVQFDNWPNENGDFGRISAENHFRYESFPAPAIVMRRIIEDYLFTVKPARDRNWQKKSLVPSEDNRGLPTVNLLGWAPSVVLSKEQKMLLEQAGIEGKEMPVQFPRFQFNRSLFENVAALIKVAAETIEMGTPFLDSETGSIGQMIFQKRDQQTGEEIFSRHHYYSDGCLHNLGTFTIDTQLQCMALVMSFRVQKEAIGTARSYACYDFNQYHEVPDSWHDTRNATFEYGDIVHLNQDEFKSPSQKKALLRTRWIRKKLGIDPTNYSNQ